MHLKSKNTTTAFREIENLDLRSLHGGVGPWEVGGAVNGSSRSGPPSGMIDLTYHHPHSSVTGSLSSNGHSFETGIQAGGRAGNNGTWSGNFKTDGHDWSATGSVRYRF